MNTINRPRSRKDKVFNSLVEVMGELTETGMFDPERGAQAGEKLKQIIFKNFPDQIRRVKIKESKHEPARSIKRKQ